MVTKNSTFKDRLESEVSMLRNRVTNTRDYVERSDEASLGLVRGLLQVINEMCNSAYIHEVEIRERQQQVTNLFTEFETATKSNYRLSVEDKGSTSKFITKIAARVMELGQNKGTNKLANSILLSTSDPKGSGNKNTDMASDNLLEDDRNFDLDKHHEDQTAFHRSKYYMKDGDTGFFSKIVGSPTSRRVHNAFLANSDPEHRLQPAISIGNGMADISFEHQPRTNKKESKQVQTDWRLATLGSPNKTPSHNPKLSVQTKLSTNKKLKLLKDSPPAKPTIVLHLEPTPKPSAKSPSCQLFGNLSFYLNNKRHIQRPLEPLFLTPRTKRPNMVTSAQRLSVKPSWVSNTKILRMSSLDDRKRAASSAESQLNLSKAESTNLMPGTSDNGYVVPGRSRSRTATALSARSMNKDTSRDKKPSVYPSLAHSTRGSTENLAQDQFDPDSVHNPGLFANLYSGLMG